MLTNRVASSIKICIPASGVLYYGCLCRIFLHKGVSKRQPEWYMVSTVLELSNELSTSVDLSVNRGGHCIQPRFHLCHRDSISLTSLASISACHLRPCTKTLYARRIVRLWQSRFGNDGEEGQVVGLCKNRQASQHPSR